jgi:folate-binding protein YgfZ
MPEDPRSGAQGGTWSAPAEQLQLAARQPVVATLSDLGVVAVRGVDATQFLNGQLTVDVAALDAQGWQLGAYCSVKGRVLALYEMWRSDDGFCLVLPVEQAAPLRTQLSRFVLRSKVTLHDVSDQWAVLGLTGPGIETTLQAAGLPCAPAPWTSQPLEGGGRLARVPPSARTGERFMLVVPASAGPSWLQKLASVAQVDRGVWWWSKIDAGLPDVFGVTLERFVPQVLNLDVLGAVHFRKGCYPGQEVVARSQYLGKLRRRMSRASAERASAGEDVFNEDEPLANAVGSVVMAAASPDGGVDLLVECPSELAQTARLRVGSQQPVRLTLRPVPYPMINPTA